eukprot:3862139-Pleurochrysis_carterae.AAC.2
MRAQAICGSACNRPRGSERFRRDRKGAWLTIHPACKPRTAVGARPPICCSLPVLVEVSG